MKKVMTLMLMLAFLSGCEEKVDVIDSKAVARWDALIDNNYEKAYSYIAPSYRQLEDLTTYRMRIQKAKLNIQWNEVTFESKECTESSCVVSLNVNYTYKFSRRSFGESTASTVIEENWIKDEGTWYFLPKESAEL